MDHKQYRKALDQLQMSQLAAGELFEVGARTSRRWALGEARIPKAVAMWLDFMVKKQLKLEVPVMNDATRQIWTFKAASKLE
jgi:hypothetical protein